MATYLVLNLVVMAIIAVALIRHVRWNRGLLATLIVLTVCTAVFDSLIVMAGIVAYDTSRILGIVVGVAPIEDFFYAFAVVMLIPTVWHVLGGRHEKNSTTF